MNVRDDAIGSVTRRSALMAGFAGFCLCCLPTLGRAEEFTLSEVVPGVHIRHGVNQDATASNLDAIANIGFIVGEDAVLVTDSGGSLSDGKWLRAQIEAKTKLPIRYVVISHVHPDHAFGAGAFTDIPGVTIIGHEKLPIALGMRGDYYKRELDGIIGAANTGPVVMPTRLVKANDHIDLGNRVISFHAHGPAHTTSDLSMIDERTGLLLPADLLFVNRIPSLDGSLLGWLHELDVLAAKQPHQTVPGHGPVIVDFGEAVKPLRSYLEDLRDGARAAIKNDVGIEKASETVGQNQKAEWLLFDNYNGRNVIEAYKELEWE